ncbi:uncharacterized protein LOC121635097 [Melanotaenia boesemani]|uniref:uncharacterized protein LOC121635097 n=1 Tax=Melanotaenia boesemani TaxID=1250792 RepID=UPI001C042677|nr:uncharacterized protein LOC121635097 [Melanotaenia boesemani]
MPSPLGLETALLLTELLFRVRRKIIGPPPTPLDDIYFCNTLIPSAFVTVQPQHVSCVYKGSRLCEGTAAFSRPGDFLQSNTVCRHKPRVTMYITELQVSLNKAEEAELREHHFKKLSIDLNKGAGGKEIHLWYKEENCSPITRIQFSFNTEMSEGLNSAGYRKVDKNLNAGTGGDEIYLWYYKGSSVYDIPIVKVDVSTDDEAQKFKFGWERMTCDLNRNTGGHWIYLWLQREKQVYVCDITATDSSAGDQEYFENGYIRVDENTNRGAGEASIFIWYRLTTDPKGGLTDLQISTNDKEYENLQNGNYQPVNQDLNEGTQGNDVFLWYNKADCNSPIKTITVIFNKELVEPFQQAGVHVFDKSLNSGNGSGCWPATQMFLCFYK